MKVLRKHNSTKEAVRDEIETLLPSLMERFGDSVSDVNHDCAAATSNSRFEPGDSM